MNRTILILANSIRQKQRCIAGREAIRDGESGAWRFGDWLRPVSHHGDGEICLHEMTCRDGTIPRVLELVAVPLRENANVPYQPEDHFFETGRKWEKHEAAVFDIAQLIEEPPDLWLDPTATRTERVSPDFLTTLDDVRSLYLIRPNHIVFRCWTTIDPQRGHEKRNRRAEVLYHGTRYSLPITDPTMDERYFDPFPGRGQPPKMLLPKNPGRCLLVVSLGACFTDGYHYKIAATVLDY